MRSPCAAFVEPANVGATPFFFSPSSLQTLQLLVWPWKNDLQTQHLQAASLMTFAVRLMLPDFDGIAKFSAADTSAKSCLVVLTRFGPKGFQR